MNDYQTIQNYLLLLFSSDKHLPIRRSLDWIHFKIKDIDIQEDNYMTDEMLVFNKYKTSKTKGQQRLEFANYKRKANSLTTQFVCLLISRRKLYLNWLLPAFLMCFVEKAFFF